MANTPNFALYKPSRADSGVEVDVSLTDNFVKIDTELKNNKDGLDTHKTDVNAHASDKITHADGSVKTTLDNHEERLTSGELAQADHETRISSTETTVADHETRLTGVEGKADNIDNRVTDIETLGLDILAPNLEGRLATVESDVEGFLAPATFDAMDSQSYTFDEYRIGYVDSRVADIATLKPSGKTDNTDSVNAQNMVNTYNVLLLGSGTFTFTNQIIVKEKTLVIGRGIDNTIINSTYSGFAFSYKSTAFNTIQSPQFRDFRLNCNSGIQLNDPTKDIVDGSSANPQPYVMRPLVTNIIIAANVQNSGTGLELIKCFDAHVRYCNFLQFNIGIHTKGTDISSIKHNRVSGGNVCIHVENSSTFGTQMLIEHNDLLDVSDCYVRSSDFDITIENNYCENLAGVYNCFFDINGGYNAKIRNNRLAGNNNTSPALILRQVMQLLEFTGNTCPSGINVGAGVSVTIPYTYYGYTYYYFRSVIKHELNTVSTGLPFNHDNRNPDVYAEVFNPSRNGLDTDDYGKNMVVSDDSFVMGAVSAYTQTTRFNRGLGRINNSLGTMGTTAWAASTAYTVGKIITPVNGNGHLYKCTVAGTSGATAPTFPLGVGATVTDGGVTWKEIGKTLSGTFNVKLIAKADNANQTLTVRAQNGKTTIGATATAVITGSNYKTYTVLSGVTASDLTVALNNNNDTGNTGNIYIKAIMVEYA